MYTKILVPLDATDADRAVLDQVVPLAKTFGSTICLLHVADGWAARWFGPDAVSPEVVEDHAYLARLKAELQAMGLQVDAELAFGNPTREILRWVSDQGCDLIAMSTHGHRLIADLFLGTTATNVQHRVNVPVLLVRANR
jgi:nucleotide-binding universal stress UspA family protein